jgi:hypothetical protein
VQAGGRRQQNERINRAIPARGFEGVGVAGNRTSAARNSSLGRLIALGGWHELYREDERLSEGEGEGEREGLHGEGERGGGGLDSLGGRGHALRVTGGSSGVEADNAVHALPDAVHTLAASKPSLSEDFIGRMHFNACATRH